MHLAFLPCTLRFRCCNTYTHKQLHTDNVIVMSKGSMVRWLLDMYLESSWRHGLDSSRKKFFRKPLKYPFSCVKKNEKGQSCTLWKCIQMKRMEVKSHKKPRSTTRWQPKNKTHARCHGNRWR